MYIYRPYMAVLDFLIKTYNICKIDVAIESMVRTETGGQLRFNIGAGNQKYDLSQVAT